MTRRELFKALTFGLVGAALPKTQAAPSPYVTANELRNLLKRYKIVTLKDGQVWGVEFPDGIKKGYYQRLSDFDDCSLRDGMKCD